MSFQRLRDPTSESSTSTITHPDNMDEIKQDDIDIDDILAPPMQHSISHRVSCSWNVWYRVWKLCTLSRVTQRGRGYIWYWMLAFIALGLYTYLYYQMSVGSGDFLQLITDYSTSTITLEQAKDELIHKLLITFAQVIGAAFFYSLMLALSSHVALIWRQRMTYHALALYLEGNTFYEINSWDSEWLDNVDTRLSTDIRLFTQNMSYFLFGTMYYNGVIPTIALAIAFTQLVFKSTGTFGIGVSYGTFLLFAAFNSIIGSRVATATYQTDAGQKEEKHKLWNEMQHGILYQKKLIQWTLLLNFITNIYYWSASILAYALPGVVFFLINTTQATPTRAADLVAVTAYYYYLQLVFSYAILLSEATSAVMSYGTRVSELMERMSYRCQQRRIRQCQQHYIESHQVSVIHVKCQTPQGQILIKDLNFSMQPNQNLIIMGPSGSGKSSILRILCGLWPISHGTIHRPMSFHKGLFFLPQKPYLTLGTLREQFIYPPKKTSQRAADLTDEHIRSLLAEVDLLYLLDRYNPDTVADWATTLSVGEQQRIGMARVIHQRPALAMLDEATSAVDSHMEEKFYTRCIELGIGYVMETCQRITIPTAPSPVEMDED